ncbi:MAG: sigma-70 family RNA polymerase sigma factor [Planctomycetales bacterium]|nr:sigma-70 family RNA polymerase sigma factor [Planctomycetales bacterium]
MSKHIGSNNTPPTSQASTETLEPELKSEFDQHFEQSRREMFDFLGRRISSKLQRRIDAHDLLQETYMAASRQYATIRAKIDFPVRLWLLKIARQQLINTYRQHIGSANRSIDRECDWNDYSSAGIAHWLLQSGTSPSKNLRYEELKAKIEQAVGELKETDREVLLMRHFEGRTYSEIATLLDLEESTLRQRFGRSLLRLREITKRLGLLDHLT